MTKHLLVVFGATGNQGNSVIHSLLTNPTLSSQYTIRAITRNAGSAAAQSLSAGGVEIVTADLDDPSTLPAALAGASFVFATTTTAYDGTTRKLETQQARALCAEALRQDVRYMIWSTLPHAARISGGTARVEHFDVKAEVEEYIRGLPIKAAFVAPGSYMQNVYGVLAPRKAPEGDGTYVIASMNDLTETCLPLVDARDVGAWTNAILGDPSRYEGAFFAAAQGFYSIQDMAGIMSNVAGKTVRAVRVPEEEWRRSFPEPLGGIMLETGRYFEEYGYFGPSMREDVEWAQKQAVGKLMGFEEFLRETGFRLE